MEIISQLMQQISSVVVVMNLPPSVSTVLSVMQQNQTLLRGLQNEP